jgi:glycosyltransferase involved in cell wall biosynthesis
VDHDLFAPMDKPAVRELLDLPVEKTIVAMGAFDLTERRKGGSLAQTLCRALGARDDVAVIIAGRSPGGTASARSFGHIEDERLMPFVLNAADIFVSTAIEEAFGQMLLEASACGVPVVAFDVGGVRDVVVHEETGILVGAVDATALLAAVERLIPDPKLRERLGRSGRAKVERQFTLAIQAEAWAQCLRRLF